MIIDALKEIIAHTYSLSLEKVKVLGTEDSTTFISQANNIYLHSEFKNPIPEFSGMFGLHDLARLNTIVNIPEYSENAKVSIKESTGIPSSITFVNEKGDFKNEYRFMAHAVIDEEVPSRTIRSIPWDITVIPTVQSIQRLKYQSQATGNTVTTFRAWTENGSLKFALGEAGSVCGDFEFSNNVPDRIKEATNWPLTTVLAVLSLQGEKTLKIYGGGLMEITVDSGFAIHQYSIGAVI